MKVKAIIFDWVRTLFDADSRKEFLEAEDVLKYCKKQGYRMALVSRLSPDSYTNLEGRKKEFEASPLKNYFEMVLVTEGDKDKLFDQVMEYFNLPSSEILIVDDRTVRGIKYGNKYGHPTVWVKKGRFANELPNVETGQPSYTISELKELLSII